jgi:hypothetical protein
MGYDTETPLAPSQRDHAAQARIVVSARARSQTLQVVLDAFLFAESQSMPSLFVGAGFLRPTERLPHTGLAHVEGRARPSRHALAVCA